MTTHLIHYKVSPQCENGSQSDKKQKIISLVRLKWLAKDHMKSKGD